MSDVMAANPQHYSMGGFSYGTLCNATASPIPPSQMGVCELFNQIELSHFQKEAAADLRASHREVAYMTRDSEVIAVIGYRVIESESTVENRK